MSNCSYVSVLTLARDDASPGREDVVPEREAERELFPEFPGPTLTVRSRSLKSLPVVPWVPEDLVPVV